MNPDFVRPRLILVTSPLPDGEAGQAMLRAALSAGDVASVIIEAAGRDDARFQDFAEPLVEICRDFEAAVIIADDTRCAGRAKADGLHVSNGDLAGVKDAIERFSPKLIVGCSGFETRHDALEAGEAMPDYVMFGRIGGDIDPAAVPKNLELAEWWADIVEVPAIVMGGSDIATLTEAASTGVEFVALSRAIFADPASVGARVARANAVFDELAAANAAG